MSASLSLWMVGARRSIPSGKKFFGRYVVMARSAAAAKKVVASRFGSSANVEVVVAEPVNGKAFYLGMEAVG